MRLTIIRTALSPLTSWRAYRIMRAHGGRLDFDAAWRRARTLRHPDEVVYARHGHALTAAGDPVASPPAGTRAAAGHHHEPNPLTDVCGTCSVRVLPSERLWHGGAGGSLVRCSTCDRIGALAAKDRGGSQHGQITSTPQECAATIALRVLGLTRTCPLCGEDIVQLAGLYPQQPGRGYRTLFTTDSAPTFDLILRLLERHGGLEPAAAAISQHAHSMCRPQSAHADRPGQGFPHGMPLVGEEVLKRISSAGVEALDTLLVADCAVLDWHRLVHGPRAGTIVI